MKESTAYRVAIEAIEIRQRYYLVNANAFKRQGMEFGRKDAKTYDRLEEAKKFLQEMIDNPCGVV